MWKKSSKKGSLNMSIEVIVVVVIAITVLGLGLGFVKKQIGDIGRTSGEIQSKIREQIINQIRESGKALSVAQEISLERGKQTIEGVGVSNTGITKSKFGIRIVPLKKNNPDGTLGRVEDMSNEIIFFYNDLIEKELAPTGTDVIPITVSAKSSASGNYLYKVNLFKEEPGKDGACASNVDHPEATAGCVLEGTQSFFVRVS